MRSNFLSTVTHLTSTTSLTRPALLAVAAASAVLAPYASYALDDSALPTGENVVGGSATFDRGTTNVLNINQGTDRVVINWDSFNIGSSATTQFYQPGSGSLAVNRVQSKGSDPTQILGTLRANGRVMVLDRNGVLFGANSVIDVGGIVASTGDVDTAAVMRGDARLVLSNLGTGEVVNNGLINVADGGLAAFVAPTVRNNGVINAKLGKVVLAAGTETATIDLYGDGLVELAVSKDGAKVLAENSGAINAESGTVLMTASAAKDVVDTVVNMTGVINASSATMVGGKIVLSAGGGKVKVSGKLDVSGEGAGSAKVTGTDVELDETSEIAANGGENGNGGDVFVYGDQSVVFKGNISAQGGATSGNGGTVEVSTANDLTFSGGVSTLATNGAAGTLIIDPTTMTIHSGYLDWLIGSANYMSNELLASLLASNGLVNVWATDTVNVGTDYSGYGIGDQNVDVSSYSYWWFGWHTGTTAGNLKLQAPTVNFVKDLTMGNGGVIVDATTLNLNSKVYGKNGGSTVLLGDDRLNSTNALTTINVQSSNAKIQQGISFANNGATINVAAGTYLESLLVNKSIGLYGTYAIIAPNSPGFDIVANNVTVDGFEIVGADDGIRVTNADNVTLSNNNIHNNASGDGVKAVNADNLTVSGNTFDYINGNAISLNDSDGADVLNNSIGQTSGGFVPAGSGDAVRIFNGSDNALVQGNTIKTDGRGVSVLGGVNHVINNNTIQTVDWINGADEGIYAEGTTGIDITNNHLTPSIGNSGIVLNGGSNAEITGNDVHDASVYGIQLNNVATALVDDNLIDGAYAGVVANGGSNITITDNDIFGVDYGVWGSGVSGLTIDDNYIDHDQPNNDPAGGTVGIHVDSSHNVQIGSGVGHDGNRVDDFATGIEVSANTGWTKIDANDVTDANTGITVSSTSGLAITDNDVDGRSQSGRGTGVGVHVDNSAGAIIGGNNDGNNVRDFNGNGVELINSANSTIDHNTVNNVGGNGIFVDPSPSTYVTYNNINNTGSNGVYILDSAGSRVEHNNIGTGSGNHNIGGDGVLVRNSSGTWVRYNDITNTTSTAWDVGSGVQVLNSANSRVENNDIWDTDWDGVRVADSNGTQVLNNDIDDVVRTGVYLRNSHGSAVNNNDIDLAGMSGVHVDGSNDVDIALNDIRVVGLDGILVNGGSGVDIWSNDIRDTGDDGIDVDNNSNAEIWSNDVYNTGDNGIEVSGSYNADVRYNDIDEVDGDGIHMSGSDYADIYNNEINVHHGGANTLSDGIEVENSAHVDIYNNNIDDTANVGIDLHNTDHVRVFDNLITDANTGIRLTDSGTYDANIDNNTIRNVEYGIWADDVGSLVITDNVIDGRYMQSGDGEIGIYVNHSYNAQIGGYHDGNTVEDFETGIRVINSGSADVEHNDVSEFEDYGIWASNSDYVDVKNNDVFDGDGTGIRVYNSDNAEINGNNVHHVDDNGIELIDSHYADILDNTVNDVGQNGIYVDPSNYVEIANNTVHNVGWDGIHLDDGHHGWIHNNHVGNTGGDGIDVDNNANVRVHSNSVHDAGDNGIEVSGSYDADIRYNNVEDSRGDGIEVTNSSFADVRNNEVRDSGDDGIDVDGSYMVDVNDNHVHGAHNNGIEVTNSFDADVRGNRVHYTGDDGIYVEGSDYADISLNEVHDTGDDGIDVRGGHGVDVTFNNIWGTAGDGIQSRWSNFVDILWNRISGSRDDGIDVEDSYGVDVKGNSVSYARNNGVEVTDSGDVDVSWNWVNGSGDDGIHVEGGHDVLISHNIVWDSGHDGISVANVHGYGPMVEAISFGGPVYSFYDAKVIGNWVNNSGNHGIAAYDVPHILIGWNNVKNSGYGYDTLLRDGPSCSRGGDGIHVEVSDRYGKGSGDVLVDIIGNSVTASRDDGIEVDFTHYGRKVQEGYDSFSLMSEGGYEGEPYAHNTVNINVLGNDVYDSGDDGIVVTLHGDHDGEGDYNALSEMNGFFMEGGYGGHGHGYTAINVVVSGNTIDNPVDSYEPMGLSFGKGDGYYFGNRGDGIQVDSFFSPWANVVTDTTVSDNSVSNSGENGVYISGPSHDFVTMFGNVLNNNPVGVRFESGTIDLTGPANTINGGEVGMLFSPYLIGYDYGYGGSELRALFAPSVMTPIYAPMSLVDDTIGTTFFNGQTRYYVELDNGAFFYPGMPTLLNGLDATYDGFRPASHGGILTQAQYNHLENMIYHYRDDNTLGLFFFGYVPQPLQLGFAQEDVYRLFGAFAPRTPSGGLVITGLPSVGGGFPTGGAGAPNFANIAPAAGEDEEDQTAEGLGAIEPAAGDTSDAPCWGDATGMLGQGTAVSYSFGDEGSKLLDKAAACGGQNF